MTISPIVDLIVKAINWCERKRWEIRQRTPGHVRIESQWQCLCCPKEPVQWKAEKRA